MIRPFPSLPTRALGHSMPGGARALRSIGLLALLSAATLPVHLRAAVPPVQDQDSTTQEASDQEAADQEAPSPISTARFADEEANTLVLLRDIERDVLLDEDLRELFSELQDLTSVLDDLYDLPETVSPGRYPLRRVESLRAQWVRLDGRLEGWRRELSDRIAELEATQDELDRVTERFAATDSTLDEGGASELVRLRIDELLERVDSTRQELAGELAATVSVQERVVNERGRVSEQIARFDVQLQRTREQLLRRDARPLWQLDPASIMERETRRALSLDATIESLRTFADEHRTQLLLQLAFAAFLALALVVARRRVALGDEQGLAGARTLLAHPIATATIAALFLTLVLYPAPPVEVPELALLISVPAILVLLPRIVWPAVRLPLFVVGGLLGLDVVASNLDWVPVLGRTLLLLETVLALAACWWFVRPSSAAHDLTSSRWWQLTLLFLRFSAAFLALSVVANVVGNRSLAEFLTQGVVRGAYAGVVFYAGAVVLSGLVTLFPRTEVGMAFRGVRRHADHIVQKATHVVHLAALVGWIWAVLSYLTLWEPLVDAVASVLAAEMGFGSYSIRIGAVALFILMVWLAYKISQLTRFLLEEEVLQRLDLPKGIPSTISTLSHWTILGIGLLLAAGAAGIDFSRITLVAGALGVGIGFGLQNLVNNFVSGLILVFERPIAVGDWVELGVLTGRVERIGMRSSTVRTIEGAEVIVPNSHLIQNELTNWTLSDRRRRVEVAVGVAYGTDPGTVLEILLDVGKEHPEILAYPEPSSLFTEFGDSSLNFALRAWTHTFEDHYRVRSELTVLVNEALKKAGITIPFPQRDLHLKTTPGDPERAALAVAVDGGRTGGDGTSGSDAEAASGTEEERPNDQGGGGRPSAPEETEGGSAGG